MRLNSGYVSVAVFALLVLLAQAGHALEVGASTAGVSPGIGSYLAGYGRDRKSVGVADDVLVQAVVVSDQQLALALVVIDCIGLMHDDVLEIQRRAIAELINAGLMDVPLTAERIIVTSTHTHSGPDVAGLWGGHIFSSGRNDDYIEFLVATAAEQVVLAASRLAPAGVRAAGVDTRLSWVENVSEPGLLDEELSVMQFVRLGGEGAGQSIATLTNFACHPTVLGPENHLVSADYLAGFYSRMTADFGGVNLFLQGAIGGWVQPKQGNRSFELAAQYGEQIADIAHAALLGAHQQENLRLKFATTSIDVPLENFGFRLLMFLGVLDRELVDGNMHTRAAWFSIGDSQFATHPGEASPAYSLATRELMGDAPVTFVLGLAQDAMGYILKPEYFADDAVYPNAGYLTSVSVGPQAGPLMMQALRSIIE